MRDVYSIKAALRYLKMTATQVINSHPPSLGNNTNTAIKTGIICTVPQGLNTHHRAGQIKRH